MRFGSFLLRGVPRDEADADNAGTGGGGAAKPPTPEEAAAAVAELARLKTENEALQTQAREQADAARYWHEQVKGGAGKKEPPAKTPPAEEKDVDLLELMATRGTKGLVEHLKQVGAIVDPDSVDRKIESRAQQLVAVNRVEAQLTRDYPELADKNNPFFKATAAKYGDLLKAGVPDVVAMQLAADQADLEGIRAGKPRETKEQRQARADAAGGDSGRRGGKGAASMDDTSDDLDDFQKLICERMGVPEEKYKANAKKGVRMGSRN